MLSITLAFLLKAAAADIQRGHVTKSATFRRLQEENLHFRGGVTASSLDTTLRCVFSGLYRSAPPRRPMTATTRNLKFLAAGAVAGLVSRTLVSPLEVVATVNMAAVGTVEGPWDALVRLWATEGMTGLYKGNGANCLKVAPTKGIQFVSFEFFKRQILMFKRWQKVAEVLEPIERLIAGGLARFCAN